MTKSILSLVLFTFCCAYFPQGAVAQEYTAKPGDLITISVWERQMLSGNVTVDGFGNITLPLPIGSVKVVGLTASQITELLTERLKHEIKNPTIFVSVTPAERFVVHVLGEVKAPNFILVPEDTTLQEAITQAGGFSEWADPTHIRLIRKRKDANQQEEVKVEQIIDFSQFVENMDFTANPTLKRDDIVVVPRLSRLEKAEKRVNVIGDVASPGAFDVEEPLPLIDVLTLAGGLSPTADLKKVSILTISDDKYSWRKVNFETFLAGDDLTANPKILPGETVFVPKIKLKEEYTFSVNVLGQVVTPRAYPATDKTRLFDAIFMAGGFAGDAAIDKVTIIHQQPESPIKVMVDVKNYLITGDLKYNPLLAEGDSVFVPLSEDAKEVPLINAPFSPSIRIRIIGEVTNPKIYQVSPQSTVLDVLTLAGGPTTEADLKRVTIIREKTKGEQRLKINLDKALMEGELKLLPPLAEDDIIFLPKIKPKRNIWGTLVNIASGVSTIVVTYFLITGR